jgi:6-phosphogluconate dehydrogenase
VRSPARPSTTWPPTWTAGDIIIDGGNSYYRDDIRRAGALSERGIHHIDCGTSGGVWGIDRGFCLMIGGETDVVEHLRPIFATIAPGVGSAPAPRDGPGSPTTAELGFLHCGPTGPAISSRWSTTGSSTA